MIRLGDSVKIRDHLGDNFCLKETLKSQKLRLVDILKQY